MWVLCMCMYVDAYKDLQHLCSLIIREKNEKEGIYQVFTLQQIEKEENFPNGPYLIFNVQFFCYWMNVSYVFVEIIANFQGNTLEFLHFPMKIKSF